MSVKIAIPTIEYAEKDGKITAVKESLDVTIDTSFNAHLKWEEHFQSLKGVDLSTMATIVHGWIKDPKEASKHLPDLMRVLYCFIESDNLPTFSHFVKLLNHENFEGFIEKMSIIIQEVGKTASKN